MPYHKGNALQPPHRGKDNPMLKDLKHTAISIFGLNAHGERAERHWSDARDRACKGDSERVAWIDNAATHPDFYMIVAEFGDPWTERMWGKTHGFVQLVPVRSTRTGWESCALGRHEQIVHVTSDTPIRPGRWLTPSASGSNWYAH